jgi:hypothetical protein
MRSGYEDCADDKSDESLGVAAVGVAVVLGVG